MLRPRHRRGGGADWAAARARSQVRRRGQREPIGQRP